MRRIPALLSSLGLAASLSAQAPRFSWGFEERVRSEAWNNLDHSEATQDTRLQYRFRTRLWAGWQATESLAFTAGLVNEDKHLEHPDQAVYAREIVFETLRMDWRLHPQFTLKLGRQDLQKGEGFVLFDGTPLDGSRTSYSNAVDLVWNSGAHSLDLIALSNPHQDRMLPRLNESPNPKEQQQLSEWDLTALGGYYTRKGEKGAQTELYALHATATGDARATSHPQYRGDRRIEILGTRLVRPVGERGQFAGEGTLQLGNEQLAAGDREIRAWGGYARYRYAFAPSWKPSLSLGLIGLSGEAPGSNRRGGWEPLFSRWPKWSELLAYTQIPETGVANLTNLAMSELEFKASPHKRVDLRATWYHLRAFENWAARGPFYGPGRNRGELGVLRVDLDLGQGFKAHTQGEWMKAGDFYAKRDASYFLRFELSYRFSR